MPLFRQPRLYFFWSWESVEDVYCRSITTPMLFHFLLHPVNRHLSKICIVKLLRYFFKFWTPRFKSNFRITFNEEEIIINPEDVDPSVGRFRNLIETTVIPKKVIDDLFFLWNFRVLWIGFVILAVFVGFTQLCFLLNSKVHSSINVTPFTLKRIECLSRYL
jgi:hypothetical protein